MRKKYDDDEQEYKKDKKAHKGLIGALKKHFKSDEKRELEGEEKEEKHYKNKHMDKDSRKKMAVMILKKKLG